MPLGNELGNLPENVILGINYSGNHDTAIAIVTPSGKPVFAMSLERITRIKQDGRPPNMLLDSIPWDKVSKVAISTSFDYSKSAAHRSKFHPMGHEVPCNNNAAHGNRFYDILDFIPVQKHFIPHHIAHAASSFWISGLQEATCIVYDGGMYNEECFGGVYSASSNDGIKLIDGFSADYDSNVANIYTYVTAALGFTPVKHEGKVTGLAAYGIVNAECKELLLSWLRNREPIVRLLYWENMYEDQKIQYLSINQEVADFMHNAFKKFKSVDIAATLQSIAEMHIIQIIKNVRNAKLLSSNICLSGGLFANVKINQRVSEQDFDNLFISPAMADDGTALGAALQLASEGDEFSPKAIETMCLGSLYNGGNRNLTDKLNGINYTYIHHDSAEIVNLLLNDEVVAVFQGEMEFGPRALGHRSILANARDYSLNKTLNMKLKRTEFMPFAPVCLEEDREYLFCNSECVKHATRFMTVTLDCTEVMKRLCPAVVHCDGTARPQLIKESDNSFLYNIILQYKRRTGIPALVNTSFNMHEEPIVYTVDDALRSFFISGLDNLYINGYLIKLKNNKNVQREYLANC